MSSVRKNILQNQNRCPNQENSIIFPISFSITVKPGSSKEEYKDGILWVKAPAVDNKANEAIAKFFKKKYKLRVRITKGLTSKHKTLEQY